VKGALVVEKRVGMMPGGGREGEEEKGREGKGRKVEVSSESSIFHVGL